MSQTGATAWDADRTIVRFPDPAIEVVDDRFGSLVVGQEIVERLWTGGRWLEGSGLVRRWALPAVLRYSQRPDAALERGDRRGHGVPAAVQQQQRQHPRPPGPADHLRAPQAPGHPDRARRRHHGADRQLRRQALERPQRCDGALRRLGLVHRSRLRHRGQLRGRQGREAFPRSVYRIDAGHRRGRP